VMSKVSRPHAQDLTGLSPSLISLRMAKEGHIATNTPN
jgi:hypothetical protein